MGSAVVRRAALSFVVAAALGATSAGCGDAQTTALGSFAALVPLKITTSYLLDGTLGQSYAQTLEATGGYTPYVWSADGLAPGLSLDGSSGKITGTLAAAGSYQVRVSVKDQFGNRTERFLTLRVLAP